MNDSDSGRRTVSMDRRQMVALLEWYVQMGADEAIGEAPIDRYALGSAAQATGSAPAPVASRAPAADAARVAAPAATAALAATPDEVARDAEAVAQACTSLAELEAALRRFDGCALKRTAKNLVFADGNPEAGVVFLGEGPGREEDLQGLPFVGRSGQLLDRMLAAIGLDRASAYICNVIFWRPPGNRNPTPAEMAACRPFSRRQIELARPSLIMTLGAVPAHELIGETQGILRLRGRWQTVDVGGRPVPVLPTLHPAYLLRQPAQKKLAWRDLVQLRIALDRELAAKG